MREPPRQRGLGANWATGLSLWAFVVGLLSPSVGVGVDWPRGWQALLMAAKDALSLALAPTDPYVLACLAGTLANLAYALAVIASLFTRPWRRRTGYAAIVGAAGAMAFGVAVPPLLAAAGLLAGVHVGYLLWLVAFALPGYAAWRRLTAGDRWDRPW